MTGEIKSEASKSDGSQNETLFESESKRKCHLLQET